MRSITVVAVWLMAIGQVIAIDHGSFARRHTHHKLHKRHAENKIAKRDVCKFPKDAGLVAVTPDAENAGWAMSPDQPCKPGNYCPYACPPGQLMAQWNPEATAYKYPESMDGGLYCDENGEIHKPFPNKPYCYAGTGSVTCKNKAPKPVSFCQTVLPGNEAMLIPTDVDQEAVLAVPDPSYWAGTAAHYYINPPGVSHEEACVWGTKDKPIGNWSPYVAGANAAESGETFVKLGWNPIYIEPDVAFRNVVPDWGVKIECDGECSGLPCEIDPNKHSVNECSQHNAPGAGGANFCVVGVPKGVTATFVVFPKDGGDSGDIKVAKPKPKPQSQPKPQTYNKGGVDENGSGDGQEISKEPSSSYVAPSKYSTSQKTTASSSSSSPSSTPYSTSSTSSEEDHSGSSPSYYPYEDKPSTTLEKVSYVASATGYMPAPTNGTVSTVPGAPKPEETFTSSASSTTFPTLALLLTIAYSILLL
ncbi:hypothetical protein K440DRAFT_592531 [Wilcoxina mikolae CBS 423.85]|nr:hypothetical protein K440DRAFT_592531 [Wilcoxina mikolae CBS 423.85]